MPETFVSVATDSKEPQFMLIAPVGFEWKNDHRIWYNKNLRTSIMPSHAPGTSFQTVVDDFVAKHMLAEHMELVSKGIRDIGGRPTLLVHGNRLNANYPQQFCTVAFGTKTGCAQITAIYPSDLTDDLKSEIERSLLTSSYGVPD